MNLSRHRLLGLTALLTLFFAGGSLMAACVGCGGTSGGNQPCYTYGEVVSDGSWYSSAGCLNRIRDVYIGGCQIERTTWVCGQWYSVSTYSGGCTCGGHVDYPMNHVLEPYDLFVNEGGSGSGPGVVSDRDMEAVEVYNLITGEMVGSYGGVAAGEELTISLEGVEDGQAFVVAGYVDGVIQGFANLRKSGEGVEQLRRYYNWSTDENHPLMQCVVYTSSNVAHILMQTSDGVQVVEAETTVR